MKLPLTTCALFICVACSTTTTSEDTADSSELAVNTMASEFSEGGPLHIKDTTYTEVLPPSLFTSPQLNAKIAYVFAPGGLDVYEAVSGEDVLGKVDWRTRLQLALPLINNAPTDTLTIDGLKGRMVEISYGGKPGYVFSGYLVGMPVPDPGATIIDYFTKNLHLVKPATRSAHECMSCDDMFSEATYEFENGITVRDKSTYESYDDGVTFKGKVTLQEVYLLARHFYTRLSEQVSEFPGSVQKQEQEGEGDEAKEDGAEEEQEEGDGDEAEEGENPFSVSIADEGGRITSIMIRGGEGCTEEEAVFEGEGEIVMSSNGGC